jgi:hypothetical protein
VPRKLVSSGTLESGKAIRVEPVTLLVFIFLLTILVCLN